MGESQLQLQFSKEPYLIGSDSTRLHTVDIWKPELASASKGENDRSKLWLIWIHGGAWADPFIDSDSFRPAVTDLWKYSSIRESIAGFASINHRLSSYPSHPTDPSSSEDPARNIHFPEHLEDVGHALRYLEEQHNIASRYLLIGHSAGATMVFELQNGSIPSPAAVLGIAGIYHFNTFLEAHPDPFYRWFMENAFPDKALWEKAAPYKSNLVGQAAWEHVKTIIIAHSPNDTLVEMGQASSMLECARKSQGNVHFLEVKGGHDAVWVRGDILADLIIKSINILQELLKMAQVAISHVS